MLAVGTVVVLVAATLVVLHVRTTSQDSSDAPGVTSTSILLGSHQPLTGPAAPGYKEVSAAANAFFKYVNDHGGVYGRSIDFDYKDDAYNPVNTLRVTQQLVAKDKVFAMIGGLGTATHQAVVNYLNTNGVPDLFVESGCTCFNNPSTYPDTFGYFPNYKIEGKILGSYVETNFPDSKVAYLLQDDDLGQNSAEGLNQVIPTKQLVSQQNYDPNQLTNGLGEQIAADQQAGAQVVVIFGIQAAVALSLLAAAQLNYHPTFIVSNVGSDTSALAGLISQYSKGVANISLANGMITDSYIPSPDDLTNPWVQLFHTVHDTYDTGEPFDFTTVSGMVLAYATYQALHAAGPNLTRQGLLNALTTQGASFHGPNVAPYGFSATNHGGMVGTQVGTTANGKLILSGPVLVTDDQDAPVTQYHGTATLPPTNF
jgi:ABC-type branched-subunit amino acid transport system substrate-binding protein